MVKKKTRKVSKKPSKNISKPFARKPKKIPKKIKKKRPKGKYPTNRKNNITRVLWREVFGTGQKFNAKDWSQKILWVLFSAVPSLIIMGSVFWINRWNGTKNFYLKWSIFPFFVFVLFTINLLIILLWIQAMLFASIIILIIISIIILWWMHKFSNYLRNSYQGAIMNTKAYKRLNPNSVSANRHIPRVKQPSRKRGRK